MATFDPLFSGQLFLPSTQLIEASSGGNGAQSVSNPTINSGLTTGDVFDGRGNDFLDPDKIQGTADDFGGTISATTTDVILAQLVNVDPFGVNPNSLDVLNQTHSILNSINSPNFGRNVIPSLNSNPVNWKNPTALEIQLGTNISSSNTIFGQPFIFGSPQAQAQLNPNGFVNGSFINGSLLNVNYAGLINALQNNQSLQNNQNIYNLSNLSGLGLSSNQTPVTLNLTLNNPTFTLNPTLNLSQNLYLGLNNNLMGWLQNANTPNVYNATPTSTTQQSTPTLNSSYGGYGSNADLIQIAFQI